MYEKKLLKTCNSIMNILLTKKNLKKNKHCKPFFANLKIISSKKITSKHFKKIHKTLQCFVLLYHKNTSSDKSQIKNVTNK